MSMSREQQVIKSALDRLLESRDASDLGPEFENPEMEFICEWVILHAHNPAIIDMWTAYRATFTKGERA